MPGSLSQELDLLQQKLLVMAGHAERAVTHALRAFTERDSDLARQVRQDDSILDGFEKEMDHLAIELLARAGLAHDMRLITVAMKVSNDLERVGDEATTIARCVLALNGEPPLRTEVDLAGMAGLGLAMLKEALEAFVRRDPAQARAIIPRDKQIDALNKQLHRELAGLMAEQAATISRGLHLMTISKSLERVGDHATNIAEVVVYLHGGEDIRHDPKVKRGAG